MQCCPACSEKAVEEDQIFLGLLEADHLTVSQNSMTTNISLESTDRQAVKLAKSRESILLAVESIQSDNFGSPGASHGKHHAKIVNQLIPTPTQAVSLPKGKNTTRAASPSRSINAASSDCGSTDSESVWMSDYSGFQPLEDDLLRLFESIKSIVIAHGLLSFQNAK